MGELIGTVTRTFGAPYLDIDSAPGGVGAQSPNGFVARKANGTVVGTNFGTLRDAQRAVESAHGPGVRWTRQQDLRTRLERYEGRSIYIYPRDLGTLLTGGGWWRGDQGVRRVGATAGPPEPDLVPRWSSWDGSGTVSATQTTPADEPRFDDDGLSGQACLTFDAVATQFMATTLTGAVPPPLSVFAVARWLTAGREQIVVQSDGGLAIQVSAAGRWQVVSGATTLDCGAAVEARPELLSVLVSATAFQAFRNGTLIGGAATVPVAGDWRISDAASSWHRDIGEVLVVPNELNQVVHDQLVTQYFQRRYLELPH